MIAIWSTGQMRLLKCVAFLTMVMDHGQKSGAWQLPDGLASAGKLAFPLFVIAFAVGVAKTGKCRVWRLGALAVLAQPAFVLALGANWWDLNVLFVFVAGWWIYQLGQQGRLQDWLLAAALLAVAHVLFKNQSGGLFWPLTVAFALWATSACGWWRVVATVGAVVTWSALRDPIQVLAVIAVLAIVCIAATKLQNLKIPKIEFGSAYAWHLLILASLNTELFL